MRGREVEMRSSLRIGLGLAALVAGALLVRAALHRAEPAPAAPTAVPEPPASAAAPPSVCRDLLAHNERVLGGHPGPGGVSFSTSCYPVPPAGSGAWALRLAAWKKTGDWAGVETWQGGYTVVRIDATRREVKSQPPWAVEQGINYSTLSEPLRVDVDGDGQPELFVRQRDKEHEGASEERARLYTFREGKVVEYPGLPRTYAAMEDADGDGRLDVSYHPYASSRVHPGSGFDFTSEGPALLAHALPDGTFSTTDAAAQAFARKDCPTPRGSTADAGTSDVDPELCARLWGASEAEALALLRSLCPEGAKCKGGCAETNDPCAYFEDRARRLAVPPPLRLGP